MEEKPIVVEWTITEEATLEERNSTLLSLIKQFYGDVKLSSVATYCTMCNTVMLTPPEFITQLMSSKIDARVLISNLCKCCDNPNVFYIIANAYYPRYIKKIRVMNSDYMIGQMIASEFL